MARRNLYPQVIPSCRVAPRIMEQLNSIARSAPAFDASGRAALREEVERWRRAERRRLIAVRDALGREERRAAEAGVAARLDGCLARLMPGVIGFYWPFRGEIDLRAVLRSWAGAGAIAALPVAGMRDGQVGFQPWQPERPPRASLWGVPVPQVGDEQVVPDVILVPVVGFDRARFFLGNGSGYYDAALEHFAKAVRIGVGFDCLRIDTVFPQPRDVALDLVVTDTAVMAADGPWPDCWGRHDD